MQIQKHTEALLFCDHFLNDVMRFKTAQATHFRNGFQILNVYFVG